MYRVEEPDSDDNSPSDVRVRILGSHRFGTMRPARHMRVCVPRKAEGGGQGAEQDTVAEVGPQR